MSTDTSGEPYARARAVLRYSWIVLGVVSLLVGWVLFSRWQENRAIEQRAREKKREENQHTFEMLGGNQFEILQFYASPGVIRRGQTTELCYGVSNAKTVRLEPPSDGVWPSLSRCVEVAPRRDTTYTLIAEDAGGHARTATLSVKVH